MRKLALAFACLIAATSAASAQSWDVPSFMPPGVSDELGIYYLTELDAADWGVVGSWRQAGNLNMGVRGGMIDRGADTDLLLGMEFFGPLTERRVLPVDISWTLGAGAVFGQTTLLTVPLGLSLGRRIGTAGFAVLPYLHSRLHVDIASEGDDSSTDAIFANDIGADFELGRTAILRVAGTIGDRSGLGVGLVLRVGRRVAVE